MGKNNKKKMSLLLELLKDSKRSDRELAKVLGVSQPTVSRTRQRLVEEGVIKEFTVIPDFVKMGYEIMAISFFKLKVTKASIEKAIKVTMARPNIIFASSGQGMGKNGVIISLHKSYTDYSKFLLDLMVEGEDYTEDYDTLLISLKEKAVKPLSLKYLAEQEEMHACNMTKFGERIKEDQENHDKVIELVKNKRYISENYTAYTNPNGEQNKSAGKVNNEDQYPDIVGISNTTNNPTIIAEIEIEASVTEKESQQWRDYATLGTAFYLYVPNTKVEDAKKLLQSKNITIKGLRGYEVKDGKITIHDIE